MSFRAAFIFVPFALAGCDSGPDINIVDRDTDVDTTAPEISHINDPSPRTFGVEVFIGATVTDQSDVTEVKVVFQRETDGFNWTELRMAPLTDEYWEGVIPGNDVSSGGIRYYIQATDELDNSACLPEACREEAWHFPVVRPR